MSAHSAIKGNHWFGFIAHLSSAASLKLAASAAANDVAAVLRAMSNGVDVNAVTGLGDAPLHRAIAAGAVDAVAALLRCGAGASLRRTCHPTSILIRLVLSRISSKRQVVAVALLYSLGPTD